MTKVLFVAYRNDPRDPMSGSGADYQFYTALKKQGLQVELLGPVQPRIPLVERVVRKAYMTLTKRRYLTNAFSKMWTMSQAVNEAEQRLRPDVIFCLYPRVFSYYRGEVPCVFRTDVTFMALEHEKSLRRGRLSRKIDLFHERRALKYADRIITHSRWCQESFIQDYGMPPSQVVLFPNPAALPESVVPVDLDVRAEKALGGPLRLLLVGRNFDRKGVDIAIETVHLLNKQGLPAQLTVCGLVREPERYVHYVGLLSKDDPVTLEQYAGVYRSAHLMLLPVRFDFSPIVTSEAAAFGVPTISNDVGGVSTSVAHRESGIVLPRDSPPALYADTIMKLVNNPQTYYDLCQKTRARYERELNWEVAGQRVAEVVREVAKQQ